MHHSDMKWSHLMYKSQRISKHLCYYSTNSDFMTLWNLPEFTRKLHAVLCMCTLVDYKPMKTNRISNLSWSEHINSVCMKMYWHFLHTNQLTLFKHIFDWRRHQKQPSEMEVPKIIDTRYQRQGMYVHMHITSVVNFPPFLCIELECHLTYTLTLAS